MFFRSTQLDDLLVAHVSKYSRGENKQEREREGEREREREAASMSPVMYTDERGGMKPVAQETHKECKGAEVASVKEVKRCKVERNSGK